MKMVYGVKDKPKLPALIVFSLQQLLSIMAATLVVPVIVGNGMSSAAALFGAGVGTIVYLLFTKFKSPVFLGSSFAFINSMFAAFAGAATVGLGYLGLIIGAILAGLVYVVIAVAVKLAGVNWINKLMPAVVIGSTVAIIGLSLAGNAIGDLTKVNFVLNETVDTYNIEVSYKIEDKDDGSKIYFDADGNTVFIKAADGKVLYQKLDEDGRPAYDKDGKEIMVEADKAEAEKLMLKAQIITPVDKDGNKVEGVTATKDKETAALNGFTSTPGSVYVAIICGLVTLAVTMLCSTYGKKMFKLIPFIMGILSGYALATVFYFVGDAMGCDALKIINFSSFSNIGIFEVPDFTFLTAFGAFGKLTGSYIGTVAVAYVPVAFVVFAEHIADHKNLSTIIEQDLLEEPGLHRTLLGDGVGSMAGAFFGGCPNTTYGESVGCVAITKNASVYSIIGAAILSIIIAFFTPFVAFVNSIPSCVMGGVCMALYGFIAVSGLKMIKNVNLDENKNLFVVSVIFISGIGGLSLTFGKVTLTTTAVSLILGILVNLMLSRGKNDEAQLQK